MHNYLFSDFGYTYGKIRGLIYGTLYLLVNLRADKIVALSKDAQHYYSRFLPSCKLTYAYNTRVCDFSKKLSTEEERAQLYRDLLIGVTSWWRRKNPGEKSRRNSPSG